MANGRQADDHQSCGNLRNKRAREDRSRSNSNSIAEE